MGEYNRYLTNKGVALCAKIEAGLTELNITKIATGSGVYSEGESVVDRTALKSPKQETTPTSSSVINTDTARIRFSITNKTTTQSLDEGYNVTEIGVFAQDPDEGEILYTICVAKNNKWDTMPAWVETDLKPFIIVYDLNIKVQDTQNITLNIDLTAYALNEDFVEHKAADVDSEGGAHGLKLVNGKFQVYNNDTWSDAPVETLAEQNKIDALNIKMLGYTVPDEMTVQNYVDEETRTFHQRVGRVELGLLKWQYYSATGRFLTDDVLKKAGTLNLYCYQYLTLVGLASDMTIQGSGDSARILLKNDSMSGDVSALKTSLQGVYLYYELETERVFPIDGQEAGYLGKSGTRTNLLNCTLATETKNDVTCEYLGDGTYRLNGTNNASSSISFILETVSFIKGKRYKLVGCPLGGGAESYRIMANRGSATIGVGVADFGEGVIFTPQKDGIDEIIIRINSGVTVNNLIFKPMLTTDLSATYDDFVPYTGDTGSLNGDVAQVRGAIGDAWNNTDTYSNGDLRIDENGLYRCLIQNVNQKPSENPYYWEKTSIEELMRVKSATVSVSILQNSLVLYKTGNIVVVSYIFDSIAHGNDNLGVVGTLPQGFIPRTQTHIASDTASSNADGVEFRFKTNGEIEAIAYRGATTDRKVCRFNGSYIAK